MDFENPALQTILRLPTEDRIQAAQAILKSLDQPEDAPLNPEMIALLDAQLEDFRRMGRGGRLLFFLYRENRMTKMRVHAESSYNDRFLIGIQLAVAKHLSDKLRQDIKEVNLFKARKGVAPGHSPFGYKYDRKEKLHRIDPEREAQARYIFDEFDTGLYSLDEFAAHLNEKGILSSTGKFWKKNMLHQMLTNPFFHGEFIFRGQVWPGTHPPYHSKNRYESRVERLGNGFVGRKSRGFDFALARLLRCRCGLTMTGQQKKGQYIYYTHRCKETGEFVYHREAEILESLDRALSRSRLAPAYAEHLKLLVKAVAEEQKQSGREDMEALNRKELELVEKKSRLYDLFAESKMDVDLL